MPSLPSSSKELELECDANLESAVAGSQPERDSGPVSALGFGGVRRALAVQPPSPNRPSSICMGLSPEVVDDSERVAAPVCPFLPVQTVAASRSRR
jgi:hypothetical protein